MYVKDVKDGKRTYTYIFVHGMWHVEDVRDVILIFFECNAIYVEDRSNTPKGCNAMYVEDVNDGKRTFKPYHIKKVMSKNVCVCSFPIFDIH